VAAVLASEADRQMEELIHAEVLQIQQSQQQIQQQIQQSQQEERAEVTKTGPVGLYPVLERNERSDSNSTRSSGTQRNTTFNKSVLSSLMASNENVVASNEPGRFSSMLDGGADARTDVDDYFVTAEFGLTKEALAQGMDKTDSPDTKADIQAGAERALGDSRLHSEYSKAGLNVL
jgi:hypothetical protein